MTVATIAASFTALPIWVPRAVSVGGLNLNVYEAFLILAAAGWLLYGKSRRNTDLTAAFLAGFLVLAALISVLAQMPAAAVIFETRRLLVLAVAIFVAGRAWGTADRVYLRAIGAVLWVSAVITILASATGLDLGQRALAASLEYGDELAATRLLTEATYLGVAVLSACLCLFLASNLSKRAAVGLVLPAVLVVLLSFSRNPLLSLGVAAVVALISAPTFATLIRALKLALIAGATLLVVWGTSLLDPGGPVERWLSSQFLGFADRVIGGLSSDALSADSSALYRAQQETPYLVLAFQQSPVFGHGFGFEYKPDFTGRRYASAEIAVAASRYAHHFFLWMLVKTGLVGLLAFLTLTLIPALRALGRRTPAMVTALAAALLGMFAQSFVAPMPIGTPTCLLFGALVGAVAAGLPQRQRGTRVARAG
jgi:O-antigen ligase